jgi:oligoribonuclease NrnB/cAMP/cGMP phosphodiesterase (DHH superfamily)
MNNTVTAEITLVEHGYQIDITDHTKRKESKTACVCRDFGGDYDISEMATSVVAALIQAMAGLEKNHKLITRAG